MDETEIHEAIRYVVPEGKDEEYAIAEIVAFVGADRVEYSHLHKGYRITGHLGFKFTLHPGDIVIRDQFGCFPVREAVYAKTFKPVEEKPAEEEKPAPKRRAPRKPKAGAQEALDV